MYRRLAKLDQVLEVARRSWPGLPSRSFITTFSGLRSHLARHDFVLGEVSDAPYFFNAAGIESPGLTAAPAIAVDLALEIRDRLGLAESDDYRSGRPPVYRFRHMSLEDVRKQSSAMPTLGGSFVDAS